MIELFKDDLFYCQRGNTIDVGQCFDCWGDMGYEIHYYSDDDVMIAVVSNERCY